MPPEPVSGAVAPSPGRRRTSAAAAKYTATSAAKGPAWKKSSPISAPKSDALPTTEIPWLSDT